MKDGTKTLEQLRREVERAIERADGKLFDWVAEYDAALESYETRRRVTLLNRYGVGTYDVSKRVETDGLEVYEFDIDAPSGRVKCTTRAIKRLRMFEKKIEYWTAQLVMAETALDVLH